MAVLDVASKISNSGVNASSTLANWNNYVGQADTAAKGVGQGYGVGSNYGPSGDIGGATVVKPKNTTTGTPGGTTVNPNGFSNTSGKFGVDSAAGNAAAGDAAAGDAAAGLADIINNAGDEGKGGYVDYGGGGGGGAPSASTQTASDAQIYDLATGAPKPYTLPEIDGPNPDYVDKIDTTDLKNILQQIVDTQKQQSELSTNYTVEQGVNELTRALEDAAKQYDTQRAQISAEEANALDNQALYAASRGDKGGIGLAQYNSIQNTAAQNRRAVSDAQVKLSTDTARQISDLRAKGEFEKADQLLSITQSYLSQLMNLEQWGLETNLGVDEFNSQLNQWVDEYKMSAQKFLTDTELAAAQLTGMFADGTRTANAQSQLKSALASSGSALLEAGIMPTLQQLDAMGMTEELAQKYLGKKGY